MSRRVDGDPIIDDWARKITKHIKKASTAKILRNLDLRTIEMAREACTIFLARSEKYIRIRMTQSPNINNARGR